MKQRLDRIALQLTEICQELDDIYSKMDSNSYLVTSGTLEVDKQALQSILTDLHWAIENCTVIGLHQIGEALNDKMGF